MPSASKYTVYLAALIFMMLSLVLVGSRLLFVKTINIHNPSELQIFSDQLKAEDNVLICTTFGPSFVLSSLEASAKARSLGPFPKVFFHIGDHFIHGSQGAVVFIRQNSATALIMNKSERMYVDNRECKNASDTNVLTEHRGLYIDVSIK